MNPTIEKNFRYHPPTLASGEAHARIRSKAKELAQLIDDLLPSNAGRERATAITAVENAMMWACAGIVRYMIQPVTIGADGRCDCNEAHPCPLGKISALARCSEAELRAAGVPMLNEQSRTDWRCDNCGWTGTNLTIAEAPLRHAEHNHAEKMMCSGNLKRTNAQSL